MLNATFSVIFKHCDFRLFVSTDHDFKDLTLVANLSETRYKLPKDKLEPGQVYYVGVSLVDGAYVSEKAGPIPLEATIPAHDLIVSPSGMAGVLVPIFIVIAVLGSVLAYYAHRHRRLKRNFAAFASRYSPATGAAILNAVSQPLLIDQAIIINALLNIDIGGNM